MTVSRLHTSCLMVAALLLSRGAIAESDLTLIQAPRVARPVTIVPPKFPAGTPIPVAGVKVDIGGPVRVAAAV